MSVITDLLILAHMIQRLISCLSLAAAKVDKISKVQYSSTKGARNASTYCYLILKPTATLNSYSVYTLPTELHFASAKLRWLTEGLQGRVMVLPGNSLSGFLAHSRIVQDDPFG